MPRVPTYDGFQATPTTQPQQRFDAPAMADIAGRQAQETGRAMLSAGGQLGQVALDMQREANKVRVDDATNQAVQLDTTLRAELLQIEGRNALERPDGKSLADEYGAKLKESLDKIESGLGNDAQKAAFRSARGEIGTRFHAAATGHMVKQQGVVQEDTWKATISTAHQRGATLWADEGARAESVSAIANTVGEMAAKKGWDKPTRDLAYQEAVSPMHAGVIRSMILADRADMAKAYYDANSAEMTLQSRATIQTQIADASSSQQAESAADAVWTALGPKGETDAVKQFDMEAAIREQLKGSPDAMKKGIAALRERAQAFNAQQAEVKADGINSVWGMVDRGTPMRQIRNTAEWLSLPEKDRHDISKTLESEAYTRTARQAAEANRDLAIMQRNERISYMRNGDRYLTDSDPAVLSRMTRGQVEAKRSIYGMEPTQHLLAKWDALQKPGKVSEAKMDTEDFNTIADQMGLSPYAKQTEDKKRALGTLKFRTEQLIDQEQRKLGRTLNRDEKMGVMRREMAREVTVDGGFFSRAKQVPVIAMSAEELRDVVVPPDERSKIIEAMRVGSKKHPNNPAYAPTEDNVRRLYVRKLSPAGNLIPNAE